MNIRLGPLMCLLTGVILLAMALAETKAPADESSTAFWSLRPRTQPSVPQLDTSADRTWCRNPIDAFILTRLRQEGLGPSPEADRRTLIRRLAFDLTGLPPTPEQIAAFANDSAPDAYERLVDRILDSPAYGERWGQHWLDVIRFAETEGFEYDRYRPGAWRFRDYVINSFNSDKPYDRFVTEQLAGDELEPDNPELLVAAGFQRLGAVRRNAGNPELAFSRNEVLTEMTDIVGSALLGLTLGCARCHDHMFDEISQADYYHLQAFFAAAQEHDVVLASAEKQAAWKTETDRIQAEIKTVKQATVGSGGPSEAEIKDRLRALEARLPSPLPAISTVRHVEEQRTPVHILKRGDTEQKERQVGPRVLPALCRLAPAELPAESSTPRTALARWVVDPDNPLTARVMVNRVWQRHFGRGIVGTPNDFGLNGLEPTHPELLDWLANQFVAGGWRLKPLHRLIVETSTYRQASLPNSAYPVAPDKDPENRLLASFPRRRLTAEEVRDAMLAISGRLVDRQGGPSVVVPIAPDLVNLLYAPSQWTVTPARDEHDRRSIYLIAKRNLRLAFMETFDQPDAQTSCAVRESSTHALQSLELLNGGLSNDLAESFARRLERDAGPDPQRQIALGYLLAAGRPPSTNEESLARKFLRKNSLKEFALALFNLNPFLYVN
ncbi:MAG TPA: DUF1549 and DUF1553 domain-containing protein [Planctomycetaceae bacterium]|nr:DUF1549 and DUF1553 domain-containing protein [Planctomycetaceae bacterium]